jgi:hypothetical protein
MDTEDRLRGGIYPPYGVITHEDHGSYLIIATWILACISMLFVLVRVVLRTWTARRFGLDNGFIVAALVCLAPAIQLMASKVYGLGLCHRRKHNCQRSRAIWTRKAIPSSQQIPGPCLLSSILLPHP